MIFETSIPFRGSSCWFASSRNCSLLGRQQQKQNIENIITIPNRAAGIATDTPSEAIGFNSTFFVDEEEEEVVEEEDVLVDVEVRVEVEVVEVRLAVEDVDVVVVDEVVGRGRLCKFL